MQDPLTGGDAGRIQKAHVAAVAGVLAAGAKQETGQYLHYQHQPVATGVDSSLELMQNVVEDGVRRHRIPLLNVFVYFSGEEGFIEYWCDFLQKDSLIPSSHHCIAQQIIPGSGRNRTENLQYLHASTVLKGGHKEMSSILADQ